MQILGIFGKSRSGKDSSAKYLMGHIMKENDIIDRYNVDELGQLNVNYSIRDDKGNLKEWMGPFEIERADADFLSYMEEIIWPHVKVYHFADSLKWIAINLYGIEHCQCYGTTEEKTSEVGYLISYMNSILPSHSQISAPKDRYLTAREFLQTLGDLMRSVDDQCFTKCLMQRIGIEQPPIAIIADGRRLCEVEAIRAFGGKTIFHTRKVNSDKHNTETELDNVDRSIFSAVIDNAKMTMAEKNDELFKVVKSWGWL